MDIKNSEKLFAFLKNLSQKFTEISDELAQPDIIKNQSRFRELSKELARLKPLQEKYLEFAKLKSKLEEANEILATSDDEEFKNLAQEEIVDVEENRESLLHKIEVLLASDEIEDNRNVFLEIRAGAGGNEASLFASDLLRMYTRVAERKNWKSEVISTNYSAIGGIKEIILYVRGSQANRFLKYESGVHRVQRVPVTESSGRIHTSTVTVAVLPEVDDVEVAINPKEIRIDTFASSAPGGQHVNRTASAVRLTHFPTNIVVSCQDEKSQHKNKDKAMKILKARLYELEKNRQDDSIANDRKSQVGSGERSEKIRTYNFPQNRVTDHRITDKNYSVEVILDGNLEDMILTLSDLFKKKMVEERLQEIIA